MVNSPMKVDVKVGWSTGSQDTVLESVTLQMLDQANQPAIFGSGPHHRWAGHEAHVRHLHLGMAGLGAEQARHVPRADTVKALYNKARDGTVDLPSPALEAQAESGPPLTSGFVFMQNANLWMLATDTSRQRRLTYFPEFYEYADQPAWSPDGKRIAFTYSPKTDPSQVPATDIWQVNPDGSDPKPLVTHRMANRCSTRRGRPTASTFISRRTPRPPPFTRTLQAAGGAGCWRVRPWRWTVLTWRAASATSGCPHLRWPATTCRAGIPSISSTWRRRGRKGWLRRQSV